MNDLSNTSIIDIIAVAYFFITRTNHLKKSHKEINFAASVSGAHIYQTTAINFPEDICYDDGGCKDYL